MTSESLETAIAEAERFLRKAKHLRPQLKKGVWGTSRPAEVLRAALDLRLALSDLKGPRP